MFASQSLILYIKKGPFRLEDKSNLTHEYFMPTLVETLNDPFDT